jgi:hypothetical protein
MATRAPKEKSMSAETQSQSHEQPEGPKFFVEVDGTEFPWPSDKITTEQIATLGGFPVAQGVVMVDADGNERNLTPGETVEIKPGHRFGKRPRFRRGDK